MNHKPELIVMLTHHDHTIKNAYEIFDQCKHTKAKYWGFKEDGLPLDQMKNLFAYMKKCGKTTFLEVVAYTENECLNGAQIAVDCSCDILMGTKFFDSVNDFCQKHHLKYMPFVGEISNRPSILNGTIDSMIDEAKTYLNKGVYGIDLLGYRYCGNCTMLNKTFVSQIDAPVCIAGSINSFEKLDEIIETGPWTFTIGGAFFENRFNGSIAEQIDKVYDYVNQNFTYV